MGRRKANVIEGPEENSMTVSINGKALTGTLAKGFQKAKPGIELKKAKIKDALFLSVEYSETVDHGVNKVTKDCTAPVHDDLKTAFSKLDEHLCQLCEQYDWEGEYVFEQVTCKGFSIGGSEDNEGCVLIGSRTLESDAVLNLVSRFVRWNDEDYGGASEIAEIIEACKYEVSQYIFEGKRAPEKQLEMEFNEEGL